jgi:hypothetical protein
MSSFLVNFGKFYEDRKNREMQEAARQQQNAQFFAQLGQTRELAQADDARRAHEFAQQQQLMRDQFNAQQAAQAFGWQAQGLARPAGDAVDPLTANPFQMKTGVTGPEALVNPEQPTAPVQEPGAFEIAGQRLVPTRPEDRAQALLATELQKVRGVGKVSQELENDRISRRLSIFDDIAKTNPIFRKLPGLYQEARTNILMGKDPDPVSLDIAALHAMSAGDDDTAAEIISMKNKLNAYRIGAGWMGPSGASFQASQDAKSLYYEVMRDAQGATQAERAQNAINKLPQYEGKYTQPAIGAVSQQLQQDLIAKPGAEDDMAKRLRNAALAPLVEAMEEAARQKQVPGAPTGPVNPFKPR